jgi:hypothetical protein
VAGQGSNPETSRFELDFPALQTKHAGGASGPGWYWCAQFRIGRDPIFHMLVVREDGEATPQGQYPWTCVGLDKEKILSRVQKEKRRNPVFYDALLEELMKMGEWPSILA